jgi:CubicO group peptidase (beta-lactamase class C family)
MSFAKKGNMMENTKNPICFYAIFRTTLLSFLFFSCLVFISRKDGTPPQPLYQYSIPVVDNDGWVTDSVQAVGLDSIPLENMMNFVNSSNDVYDIHSILIIKNGRLVFEEYFRGFTFNAAEPNNCMGDYILYDRYFADSLCSVTKTFTGALVGIAIDHGFIKNENERLFSYFQDYSDLNDDERKDRIEIRHLLSNTSGLYWPEWDSDPMDPQNPIPGMWRAADPIRFILDRAMVYEPGVMFNYNGGNTNLLGEIVKRASGSNADQFSRQYLFRPLGVTDLRWIYFPNGMIFTSGDLYLRPRDMAKFGQLFLNGGEWNGTRIISEDWVNKSLQEWISPIPNNFADAYGYTWWIESFQIEGHTVLTQSARGWGGQYIFLIPEKEMVVVLTAGNYYTFNYAKDIFKKYILPAAY